MDLSGKKTEKWERRTMKKVGEQEVLKIGKEGGEEGGMEAESLHVNSAAKFAHRATIS